ncbi:MAG: SDR family oxidoreductase [Methylococcaceae bacterium]|nr:SDR family oxidoreductase [Methylococcaceae bacterium]
MTTVLITGANRGLGLEFTRQYAAAGWDVIAACRQPDQANDLIELANRYPCIRLATLNVAEFDQIDTLANKLSDTPIDILINNAGVYGDERGHGFGHLDYDAWTNTLKINSQAPIKLAEAFLANIKLGNKKLIVTISSLMGSMADNTSGGSILYRSSKAAVNAAMKSLAIDLSDLAIGSLILHPGWVRTDMGGPNGLIDVEQSVSGMREVIAGFSLVQSGAFIKYDGSPLPW